LRCHWLRCHWLRCYWLRCHWLRCHVVSVSIFRCPCLRVHSFALSGGVATHSGCAAPADLFEDLGGSLVVAVLVVPPPPLVRHGLRKALRRVLPLLLTAEGSDV